MTAGSAQPVIGVLALQGDFAEHEVSLTACGARVVQVRKLAQLEAVDGLVIPGGESTTIARLLLAFDLMEPLRRRIHEGMPVWGTCAGAILLANDVPGLDRSPIGVMDMSVERNAFGRQIDSFEADLAVTGLDGSPLHAIFIRAPIITAVRDGVEAIARLDDGRIVAARQGRLLATCFHPELTDDRRMHALFASMVAEAAQTEAA
jgi:5'-phosphate synthase pdxT subunit